MFLGTVLDQLPLCAQKQQTNQNFKLSSFTADFFSSFFLLDLQKIFRLLLYSFHFFNSICLSQFAYQILATCPVFLIFILVFVMKHEFKHLNKPPPQLPQQHHNYHLNHHRAQDCRIAFHIFARKVTT